MKFGTLRSVLQFRPIELDGRKRRFARGASRAALPTRPQDLLQPRNV